MLEKRINLIDRCQVLLHKKVKSLPRPELVSHLDALQENGFGGHLPLRVNLDILERQADDALNDFFGTTAAKEGDLPKMVDDFVGKFVFWGDGQGEINLMRVTMLDCVDGVMFHEKAQVSSGQKTEEEAQEKIDQAQQAGKLLLLTDTVKY